MNDRIPAEGKAGRMLITPENGSAPFYATVTMADEPLEEGTPLNKANLLQDVTAAMYGRDQNATVNNVFADIGIYFQYWWKARGVESHYEAVRGASETLYLTYGPGSASYTLSYGSAVEINQTDGSVSLVNPTVVSASYSDDVSATVRGKYVTTSNEAGIYFVGLDAVFDSSYQREDGVSFYSATLTNCSQITSKFVESIGDFYYLRSNDRNAYPDFDIVGGIEYQFLGAPIQNAETAPKIEAGSYVGTGTTGEDGKCTLTFGFVPKLVFITKLTTTNTITSTDATMTTVFVYGDTAALASYSSLLQENTVDWNGPSVSWYAERNASPEKQLNESGATYLYVALG